MIRFITGQPGSGKSYWAIYSVFEAINSSSQASIISQRQKIRKKVLNTKNKFIKKFYISIYKKLKLSVSSKKHIITNIAGFKYSKFREYASQKKSDIQFHKLNENEFSEFCELFQHYVNEYRNNNNIVAEEEDKGEFYYAKTQLVINNPDFDKYINSILIFDEAGSSNLWSKSEKFASLSRILFLTGHRHLNDDVFFLVQNPTLLNKDYYNQIVETFYKAQKSSYRFNKSKMKYFAFNSIIEAHDPASTSDISVSVPVIKEYFSFYQTGANEKGINVYSKYVILFIAMVLLVLFAFFKLITNFTSKSDTITVEDTNTTINSKKIDKKTQSNKKDTEKEDIDNVIHIKCNYYNNNIYCKYEDETYTYLLDTTILQLKELNSQLKNNYKFIQFNKDIYFDCDQNYIDTYFNKKIKGVTNEKNTNVLNNNIMPKF